jgi:hypothetical protein
MMDNLNEIKINVKKENSEWLKKQGIEPDEFLQELFNNIYSVPTHFLWQIEKGEPTAKVLKHMFDAAMIGNCISREVLDYFNLTDFKVEDCSSNLDERYLWLHYVATTSAKVEVDSVSLWWEKGEVIAIFEKILGKVKNIEGIKKSFNRVEEEILDLKCDYSLELDEEDPEWIRLELTVWEEAMDYLPNVNYASNLFKKIMNGGK